MGKPTHEERIVGGERAKRKRRLSMGAEFASASLMHRVWTWWAEVRQKTVISAAGALITAGLAVFFLMAHVVDAGHTDAIDNWILRSFRTPGDVHRLIGPEWLVRVVRDATALGSATVVIPFALVVAGHFTMIRQRRRDALLVVAASIGALAANAALKNLFDRHRPTSVPALAEVTSSSFPSGHAMLSASIYLTLGFLLARAAQHRLAAAYYLIVAAGVVGVVGLSRVMLGVHYPSDVLAGWFAGLAWALACRALASWGQTHGIADAEPSSIPIETIPKQKDETALAIPSSKA